MSPDKCPWLRSGHLADDRNLKADNSFFVPFAGVFSVRRVHVIRKSAPLRAAIYGFPAVDFPSPAGEKLGISRRIPAFSLQILRQNPRGGHLLLPPAILVVPLSLWKPLLRPRQDSETARQRDGKTTRLVASMVRPSPSGESRTIQRHCRFKIVASTGVYVAVNGCGAFSIRRKTE